MKLLKDTLFLLIGIAFVVGCIYLFLQKPAPEHFQTIPTLRVGDQSIILEMADTEEKRVQGLSGRPSLESNRGMLFVFDEVGSYGFWMKDMHFAIDIVWISADLRVAGVSKNAQPESYPNIFYSPTPIKYVLELNSGESEKLGIDTGSELYLNRQF